MAFQIRKRERERRRRERKKSSRSMSTSSSSEKRRSKSRDHSGERTRYFSCAKNPSLNLLSAEVTEDDRVPGVTDLEVEIIRSIIIDKCFEIFSDFA